MRYSMLVVFSVASSMRHTAQVSCAIKRATKAFAGVGLWGKLAEFLVILALSMSARTISNLPFGSRDHPTIAPPAYETSWCNG